MYFIKNNRGMSLVAVIVASLIMLILGKAIYDLLNFQYKYFSYSVELGKLEDLKSYVRSNLNCDLTLRPLPLPCTIPAGGEISVKSLLPPGQELIKIPAGNDFERFGEYALKARCRMGASGSEFFIMVNRLTSDGVHAVPSTLRHSLMDGTMATSSATNLEGWTDLFSGVPQCTGFYEKTKPKRLFNHRSFGRSGHIFNCIVRVPSSLFFAN